jgi:hypothetical protein
MYLDRPTWQALHRAAKNDGPRSRRYFYATQAALFFARWCIGAGRRLDDLLYRRYATVEIGAPVFIFAAPRSGTTFLHRLLALDRERFCTVRLYETILQSITWVRLVQAIGRLDSRLGGPLARLVAAVDARCFSGWRDVHPMGLGQEEEDEAFFVFSLLSPGTLVFYPWVDAQQRAAWLDRVEPEARAAVMSDVRGALQRHLFASGRGRTFLDKSVLLASRLDAMLDAFPDARFIHLVRSPYEAIPSFVSMFSAVWRAVWPELSRSGPETRALADLGIEYYRRGLSVRERVSPERLVVLRYDDLIADPRREIARIYEHFGWSLSPTFAARLAAQLEPGPRRSTAHRYTLEEFGLSRRQIREALPEVFLEHGFGGASSESEEAEQVRTKDEPADRDRAQ